MVHPFEAALGALPSERAPEASFMESQPIVLGARTEALLERTPQKAAPQSFAACLGADVASWADDARVEPDVARARRRRADGPL